MILDWTPAQPGRRMPQRLCGLAGL